MVDQPKKIFILGEDNLNGTQNGIIFESLAWKDLAKVPSLKDYDSVVINILPPFNKDNIDWKLFDEALNPEVVGNILYPGGSILILGNPTFDTPGQPGIRFGSKPYPFLDWTGLGFSWNESSGNTKNIFDDTRLQKYKPYLNNLDKWFFALEHRNILLLNTFEIQKGLKIFSQNTTIHCDVRPICTNRNHESLAFEVFILEHERKFGCIKFFPQTKLSFKKSLYMMLEIEHGILNSVKEPEWVSGLVAPNQEGVDKKILSIQKQIENLNEDLETVIDEKTNIRSCLKVLYTTADELETSAHNLLSELGANVRKPPTKERCDGWISVGKGEELLEGVLEIKSAKNEEFDQKGLKQLMDWVSDGRFDEEKDYKGIFIGANSINNPSQDRKKGFNSDWIRKAKRENIVLLNTTDLLSIYTQHKAGLLDYNAFWSCLFNTSGLFEYEATKSDYTIPQTPVVTGLKVANNKLT